MNVDLVLYNGIIIQMNKAESIHKSVAIKDGLILDVGNNEDIKKYIGDNTLTIDLKGKTVVPGFFDSHMHLMPTSINELAINFEKASSIQDVLDLIEAKKKQLPPKSIIWGIRLDEFQLKERILPTKNDLDKVAPDQPVFISSIEFHTVTVNSYALHKMNLPFTINSVEKDSKGFSTGRIHHHASFMARKKMFEMISDEAQVQGLKTTIEKIIKKGVTSLVAMEGGSLFHDRHAEFILNEKDKLPIDIAIFYQTTDVEKVLSHQLPRIGGDIFLDGSFRSRNAALFEPYSDSPGNRGVLYFSQDELDEFILHAHQKDLQIAVHAVGGRAIEYLLNAYERVLSQHPKANHRHRVEHFELPTAHQIKRAKDLGVILSMQPTYEYFFREPNGMYEIRLGKERSRQTNPFKKILDADIIIAGGSDGDVMPVDPILGIHAAVNHPNHNYRISPYEALKMFTVNAAIGIFEENIKGTIERNKLADIVILDNNPLTIEPACIKDIKVICTIKKGQILFGKDLGEIV